MQCKSQMAAFIGGIRTETKLLTERGMQGEILQNKLKIKYTYNIHNTK